MKRKLTTIIVLFILITTITILPVSVSKHLDSMHINNTFNNQNTILFEQSDRASIHRLYMIMIENLLQKNSPSNELSIFLLQPTIRNTISTLSDSTTLRTMDILFSNSHSLTKFLTLLQYCTYIETNQNHQSIESFEQILNQLVKSNLTYEKNITFLPTTYLDNHNKTILYESWKQYLKTNPSIHHIITELAIDPILFFFVFALSMGLWGFGIGAASCCIPDLIPLGIMVVEALTLGIASGLVLDFICSSQGPFISTLFTKLCNMTGLSKIQIEIISACLLCLIVIGSYLWLWEICELTQLSTVVKIIGGGIFAVGPPILFSWFISNYYPSSTHSSNTNK